MEKGKSSKKKDFYKNRKGENQRTSSKKSSDWRSTRKTSNFDPNDPEDRSIFVDRSLKQPKSRLAELDEIWQETNTGQNFETLVNAPVSADGHFVFKFEKNWTLDASEYDDFFSLDVKSLATIIECIPFNRYVQVDDKYFTRDELTDISNIAEKGKKAYHDMIEQSMKKNVECTNDENHSRIDDAKNKRLSKGSSIDKAIDESNNDSTNIEEDLDFLLSLKEPVRTRPFSIAPAAKNAPEDTKTKNIPPPTKSIDLEKWLDLVLED